MIPRVKKKKKTPTHLYPPRRHTVNIQSNSRPLRDWGRAFLFFRLKGRQKNRAVHYFLYGKKDPGLSRRKLGDFKPPFQEKKGRETNNTKNKGVNNGFRSRPTPLFQKCFRRLRHSRIWERQKGTEIRPVPSLSKGRGKKPRNPVPRPGEHTLVFALEGPKGEEGAWRRGQ